MQPSLPTYTPLFLSLAVVGLSVFAAMGLQTPAPASAQAADAAVVQATGPGTWGVDTADPANATWLRIEGAIRAFTVETATQRHPCHIPKPGTNASSDPARPRCAATLEDEGTARLTWTGADDATFQGRFVAHDNTTLLATTADDEPSLVPGFVVSTLAAVFLIATILLIVAYIQERRVSHYLVRRLYEETKGRIPADWPENLRHQWIARIFIRGKN